jgi:hypothetical protein
MDAQKPEFQDVAAPALIVDENDNIVGMEEPATEDKKEEA